MKKVFALMIALFVLAGCNTVQGFGKDIQKVGDKLEGAAKK
ncbi:MAG: entericidin, EcnA/B family [Oxalobacter sp.]|nr:MAG: entericidin, EcnA/B family [Oxalobacter sp.]